MRKFKKRKAPWGGSQPFTIAFCYPKSGPVMIKGMNKEVENYVKTKVSPCHYRIALFHNKESRGYWRFNVEKCFLNKEKYKNKHERYQLSIFNKDQKKEVWLRKVPQHYLKELDEIV